MGVWQWLRQKVVKCPRCNKWIRKNKLKEHKRECKKRQKREKKKTKREKRKKR